jgi:hypothetical protein
LLIARALRALPKAETVKDGVVHVDQTKSRIRDAALDRFVGLLAAWREENCTVRGAKAGGSRAWRGCVGELEIGRLTV